jgi:L-malate glycosyltransferase
MYIELAKQLSLRGHKVIFVFSGKPIDLFMDRLRKARIDPKMHLMKFRPYHNYIINLSKLVLKERPDLVHGNFVPIYFPLNLLSLISKTRFIYTHHGPYLEKVSPIKKAVMILFTRMFEGGVKNVVFVSDYLLRKHIEYNRPKKDNLLRIYNGRMKKMPLKESGKNKLRSSLGLQKGDKVLLCVSHLMDFKGIQYLIDSMPMVLSFENKIRLLIVGEGSYRGELERQIKELKLETKISFLGNRNDVDKIISVSDIAVMPSITGEGLPYTIIEYMAGGIPIVATNVGGIPEQIEHMKTGIRIEPKNSRMLGESIIYLLKNRGKALGFARNAKNAANEKFDSRRVVKDYIRLYEEAIEKD